MSFQIAHELLYAITYEAKYKYSPLNPDRICRVEGCGQLGQDVTSFDMKMRGVSRRRNMCSKHYRQGLSLKRGKKNFTEILADNAGVTTAEYARKNHAYRHNIDKVGYCENVDGRLGYKCTTTIIKDVGMLEWDHKNGISKDGFLLENNTPLNGQCLCRCCHAYKSSLFKDYETMGRKGMKTMTFEEIDKVTIEADKRYDARVRELLEAGKIFNPEVWKNR